MMPESKHKEVFEATKEELTKTPVLAYSDPKADHGIQVDGCLKGLGTVLLQKGRPVLYMSITLTPAETGYSNIERELFSIVFRLERLHHYVFGSRVEVQTYYKPLILIWRKSIRTASPQLQ